MTKPPVPGTYVIVNRALSLNNERLAITYNGLDQPFTVNIKTGSSRQLWIVQDHGHNTRSLVPVDATDLQAARDAGCVTALPAHNYVWTIIKTDSGFSIQDDVGTVFWGVADAVDNAPVTIEPDNEKHRWSFEQVQ
ncbi:uncharacterized protein F5891DRAFT_1188399 [Suillus fuscotomentosus]|uniref:CCL2-like lectin domain-containing protein n=1 Tax=Suillus fuscotomentosus TaxID=1912939 RepID=A0AAD4HLE8_9AGAM|nr:uncharacterized protein F5891DRAFT_1188399 [Suillus fuscotomentosus]KAG1900491.1 hypothetical protein F5891DRAFT_1188399 [Suillus fuscotomentosus]